MAQLRTFRGAETGPWVVLGCDAVVGEALPPASRLELTRSDPHLPSYAVTATWTLRGTDSNLRYATAAERDALAAVSPPLGRPGATRAALIPIRMTPQWWELAQDERRDVLEGRSHHIATGLEYLPAVARELSHGRELGEDFDFLTWFEYTPADAARFEELVARLRATPEWTFVEREVDVRLAQDATLVADVRARLRHDRV